jgi:hypothetical protein
MVRKCLFALIAVVLQSGWILNAQINTQGQELTSPNVIQTPVPFLNIAPDSRAGAMGDMGVATSPDINSIHWNAAKYAFMKEDWGISSSYTPWLQGIANDIKLLYLTYYFKINKQTAVAMGLRYFTLGNINFTDERGGLIASRTPNEFTFDGAFSRLFTERLSGGIAFRFIRSDLASGITSSSGTAAPTAGISYATDISMYYHKPLTFDEKSSEWSWGLNISNMGSKISYSDGAYKDFLPANLRLGTAFTMDIDSYNKFTIGTDLNKLLVPTPTYIDSVSGSSNEVMAVVNHNSTMSLAQGMLSSLYEAPGGWDEKMKEIMISVGAEYWYREQFAVRGGYFYENEMKGNRKYFTVGVGLKMTTISIDFSYLVPTAGQSNPLANTMRFTANFLFGNSNTKKQQQFQ